MSVSTVAAPLALKPLFMWAGGKRRLLPKYAPYFPDLTQVSAYVEPFLGGGAVFSYVAANRPGITAVLGEINPELATLYATVKTHSESLIALCQKYEKEWMPLNIIDRKALYYVLRERYWAMPLGLEATALLYFLMKTGFNGIWQTCLASRGRYGTPVGLAYQKERVIDPALISDWAAALMHTEVKAQSYEKTVVPKGAFVYCDPPYRGSFTSYSTDFNDDHQAELIRWCQKIAKDRKALVWLANREIGDDFFERLAPEAEKNSIPIIYTAGRRKRVEGRFEAKPASEILLRWDGRL